MAWREVGSVVTNDGKSARIAIERLEIVVPVPKSSAYLVLQRRRWRLRVLASDGTSEVQRRVYTSRKDAEAAATTLRW